jgi:hypothetical protein
MKYASLCALLTASLLVGTASASSSQAIGKDVAVVPPGQPLALASYVWMPALATTQATHAVQDAIDDDSVSGKEALLMIVSGFVLSALQLRRKQKALRRARLAISAA